MTLKPAMSLMKTALIFSLSLCALLAPAPAPKAAELPIPDIPYTQKTLGNGLTVIVHEDHKAPIVAVNVWYHVGSKNEKPGRTGFAHLFEHLMFNGSENHNDDWFKVIDPLGATDENGTTNTDRTNYFENIPKPALDTVLWFESDRMGHLVGAIDQATRRAARRRAEREARRGQPAVLGRRTVDHRCLFPQGASLLLDRHRLHGGSFGG